MNAAAVLERLTAQGVQVIPRPNGNLWLEPASKIPPDLLEAVRENKLAILAHLRAKQAAARVNKDALGIADRLRQALTDKRAELALHLSDLDTPYYKGDAWTLDQVAILERHVAGLTRYLADGGNLALPRCCRHPETICLIASYGFTSCLLTPGACGYSWREGRPT